MAAPTRTETKASCFMLFCDASLPDRDDHAAKTRVKKRKDVISHDYTYKYAVEAGDG